MFGRIIIWIALVYLTAYAFLGKDSHNESRTGIIIAAIVAWMSSMVLM